MGSESVSFAKLFKADFSDLEAAAKSWRKLSKHITETSVQQHRTRVTGPLHAGEWEGEAARAARTSLEQKERQLGIAAQQTGLIAATLSTAYEKLVAARTELRNVVRQAEDAHYDVDDNGAIQAPRLPTSGQNDPDYDALSKKYSSEMAGYQQRMEKALTKAAKVSDEAATLLARIEPEIIDRRNGWVDANLDALRVADLAGVDSSKLPRKNASASEVANWWEDLDETERQLYIASYPEDLGQLNGLPSTVRDQANRRYLEQELAIYESQPIRDLTPTMQNEYGSLLKLNQRLNEEDANEKHRQLFLLGLDPSDDGRAIVSVGNPDTAKNTAVYVPGMDTTLATFGGDITCADNMVKASEQYGKPGDTAVVAWLDYDAPDGLVQARKPSYAQDAGPGLQDFVTGLWQTNEEPNARRTIVGHSYGSVAVSEALRSPGGIPVDDVIVAGSPGMRVSRAADLGIAPEHVWAGEAPGDIVPDTGRAGVAHGEGESLTRRIRGIFDGGFDHINTVPTDDQFGANRFHTGSARGHSDYWDMERDAHGSEVPNESLDNQAQIITGYHGGRDVTLVD
ncbi:alpha/beta hydrolase [Streptomyces sp. P1-3]|uniref:alpha/beta hydrolase n=1 Tax=Streptomyces sp. P1-3 TaxID=3421658 RepID=UPI003D36BE77